MGKISLLSPGVLLLVFLFAASCVSSGQSGSSRNSNILTQEEMAETSAANLYEAVDRLRPRWLQIRANRSMNLETGILVYQNNAMVGGVEVLRQYGLLDVVQLRYLDGATASATLPGLLSQHIEGAIVLETSNR